MIWKFHLHWHIDKFLNPRNTGTEEFLAYFSCHNFKPLQCFISQTLIRENYPHENSGVFKYHHHMVIANLRLHLRMDYFLYHWNFENGETQENGQHKKKKIKLAINDLRWNKWILEIKLIDRWILEALSVQTVT